MQYKLIGQTVPAVEMVLNNGEQIFTQAGGMCWQDPSIKMDTNTHGGVFKGIGRMFAGESLFMNTFTATTDNAKIAFASTMPGAILPVQFDPSHPGLIVQKGSFLCAQEGVETAITLTKKFSAGLFGGEGFILEKLSGTGMAFLEVDGDAVEKVLQPGEVILVDTGNVVAFDTTCAYEIQTVKGLKNIFLGGEGLFLTKLTGPGKVILQTQNFGDFAGRIIALVPKN